ncbi:hypothetical protein GCM10028809_28500 [Spirosoma gilvum]
MKQLPQGAIDDNKKSAPGPYSSSPVDDCRGYIGHKDQIDPIEFSTERNQFFAWVPAIGPLQMDQKRGSEK